MMTEHHRKPLSKGGVSEPRNISRVHDKQHKAWHTVFRNMNPFQIAELCNSVWLDPDYEFVVQRKGQPLPKTRNRYCEEGINPLLTYEDPRDPDFNE